jgi:hypothetical protein
MSLTKIFIDSKNNIEVFAKDFADSYRDISKNNDQADYLYNNLIILLPAISQVRITQKAKELSLENKNNFYDARIISDIRMVFDDENMAKREQYAVVIHHLRLTHFSGYDKYDDFYVTMDLADLKKLQETINRAVEKESSIIQKNHDLEFINLN